jgi:hypothetical protein
VSPDATDRALVRAAWSLGLAPARVVLALGAPGLRPAAGAARLRRLLAAGSLQRIKVSGGRGALHLYGAAPRARPPGGRAWRPSVAQLDHTLDVGAVLAALVADHDGLVPTAWEGEAEVRAWAPPGAPFPDGVIHLLDTRARSPIEITWALEVDRATESRAVWRAKLARYAAHPVQGPRLLVVVTTGRRRAAGIAETATEAGVGLVVTTLAAVAAGPAAPVVASGTFAVGTLAQASRARLAAGADAGDTPAGNR